ncbi:hypothetical protein GGU10DRAFT_369967 [Lentinula aff. detonsa]|uniref:GTP-binding protein 2 n=1 Tax=Lentinula aff. detonsa TaxID=2804958 RepID=A0AA38KW99_9AGAR|nr:hypothetical protein GGU10DRAFT_369967 [Lentinula aff. detonsa]
MFGEDESESPRVPSPWESIIELSRTSTPTNSQTPSLLAGEIEPWYDARYTPPLSTFSSQSNQKKIIPAFLPSLPPENDYGSIEYKLRLLHPSPARFTRLVTQLKWRLLEGGGRALYELGVGDDGELVGLGKKDMEETIDVLGEMASELGARVWVVRQIKLGRGAEGTRVVECDVPGPLTLDTLENLNQDSETAPAPSVLGNLHIYDVFQRNPVKVRTRIRTGNTVSSSSSNSPTSSSNDSVLAWPDDKAGAKYHRKLKKERKEQGRKKYELNRQVLSLTSADHAHVDKEDSNTHRAEHVHHQPNGVGGTRTRTQTHKYARKLAQTHSVRNISSSSSSSHSTRSSDTISPHISSCNVDEFQTQTDINGHVNELAPPHTVMKVTRVGRGTRREARDRRRAEKTRDEKMLAVQMKKAEAELSEDTRAPPGVTSSDDFVFGVKTSNVNDGVDGDAVVSTTLDINTETNIDHTHGHIVVADANVVQMDVDDRGRADIHTSTEVKVEVQMGASTNQKNEDHRSFMRLNGYQNQYQAIGTHVRHHDEANREDRPGIGRTRTTGESPGDGKDEDQPRLIIEALVIRNFEDGEAFLDFEGFGGFEGLEYST